MIGHRNAPDGLEWLIAEAVERHYLEYGVRNYIVGHYGSFDTMAAAAVIKVKKKYPDICLLLLLPYHPAERPFEPSPGFDGTYYPFEGKVLHQYAIVRANRYMLRRTDYIICYVKHSGNTRDLLEYARRREKQGLVCVENLAERGVE